MADLATDDLRAARWERRLRGPVLSAAVAVLPLLALHLTHPHGALAVVETVGHWVIWLTFIVEVAVMLSVVATGASGSTATASSCSSSRSRRRSSRSRSRSRRRCGC